jgi:hypothetical protein
MPNTYVALATSTLGTAAASVTFSSIPQTYTDLVLVINGLGIANDSLGVTMTFNGVTTNRSYTRLQGNGSTASSFRSTNDPAIGVLGDSEGGNVIANIMNYSNTTTFKTILTRYNSSDAGDGRVGSYVSLWGSTAAITSIVLGFSSGNIAAGSRFSLYGILAA